MEKTQTLKAGGGFKKVGIIIAIVIVAAVAAFYIFNNYIYEQKQAYAPSDYKNAEYTIDGQRVRLVNGVAETEAAPGSASKITTKYFGNEVTTDLDGDGRQDVAFLLTQDGGGSGTFYYVVAALNTDHGYVGSEGLLLGDRIAPQTTEKGTGKIIIVNYADRKPREPFSVAPSVGKSIWLLLDPQTMQFGEVAQNFEGEADPSKMSLGMNTWTWVSALYNDGTEIVPKNSKAFTLTFRPDGSFSATTDCNGIGGKYSTNQSAISFTEMVSTLMYCDGSQEADFSKLLQAAQGYLFTSKGELVLDLKFDSGTATFK